MELTYKAIYFQMFQKIIHTYNETQMTPTFPSGNLNIPNKMYLVLLKRT
jgi:hypothetical protein